MRTVDALTVAVAARAVSWERCRTSLHGSLELVARYDAIVVAVEIFEPWYGGMTRTHSLRSIGALLALAARSDVHALFAASASWRVTLPPPSAIVTEPGGIRRTWSRGPRR